MQAGSLTTVKTYDRLSTQNGIAVASYDYDGNLVSRDGVGGYTYYTGTHRVQSAGGYRLGYDANGNVTTIAGTGSKTLTYLPFNLPSRIQAGANTLDYLYDGAHARIKETSQTAQGSDRTWYLGAYEEHTRPDGVVEQRHYLATPEGVVGVLTRRSDGANGVVYWHKDHLGSIVALTNAAGAVQQRFAFDAWGTRSTGGDAYAEERGYTGHEHLVEVGLVHMNGRLYFDAIGRFLQADPIVQAPYAPQNYNRYSYVLNNPLSLTDPTGYSWWTKWRRTIFAVAAAVVTYGAASEWAIGIAAADGPPTAAAVAGAQAFAGAASGFAAGGIQGGNIESAVYGAFTGGVMGAVGGMVGDWSLPARIGAKAATSAALAYVQGGDWRRAARFAAFAEVGRAGWEYTRNETDKQYAASCAREGNCVYDRLGAATDGGRNITPGIFQAEWDRVWGPLRSFLRAGMSMEGSGDHMYDPGQSLCSTLGDAICGSVRTFVRQVSKPHDWGNSWSYDNDPSSSTYGNRLEGGGFESLSARVGYEIGVQSWSFASMPVMAGFTAFALYGDYFNRDLYGMRRQW